MVVSPRIRSHLTLLLWPFLLAAHVTECIPLLPLSSLISREAIVNNITATLQVFNPSTGQPVPQALASDGAMAPLVLWVTFSAVVGLPFALAGVCGGRITTGAAVGLASCALSWTAIIDSISPPGVTDITLSLVILGFFVVGFALGFFSPTRHAGLPILCLAGGAAVGVRVVLLRSGLLIPIYVLNWAVVAISTLASVLGAVFQPWRRATVTLSCASVGTFLLALAVDLVLSRETVNAGISRGLRALFDRNSSHVTNLLENPYTPSLSTQIVLAVSIGLIPIFAYAQHRIFPGPFNPGPKEIEPPEDLPPLGFSPSEGGTDIVKSRFSL